MRHVLLLRGINLGRSHRIPMAELRSLLADAGHAEVATYLQSGNVVLSSPQAPPELATEVGKLITRSFGFEVPVIGRSAAQLGKVIGHDPIPGAVEDPKRYQVTFLERAPSPAVLERLDGLALESERIAVHGRELYTWHPEGIARSKLAARLTAKELGSSATARNWATVIKLAEMASSPDS